MGLTGAFRGLSITEMLQLIRMSRKTGALHIRLNEGVQQSLFFRAGQVIGVESGRESLGPILLEQGLVSEADLNAAIQYQKRQTAKQPLEQILLDDGKVTRENLIQALMTHAERMVGALIQERGGQVSFDEGAEPELKLEIALDILSVLMAASVRADEETRSKRAEGDPELVYRRSSAGGLAFKNKTMQLWLDDWKVFLGIDGLRSLESVAQKIKMLRADVLERIETLVRLGYVEPVHLRDERKTVLIVDDSLTIQKLVEMALDGQNLKLVTANDGANALRAAGEHNPDLILLDVMLPDTNGYRLCQQIRARAGPLATVPIIMLTARDSPQDESLGKHAGATAYMTKPFAPDVLRKTVREALG
jgi:CheY-like chemotaxis protein